MEVVKNEKKIYSAQQTVIGCLISSVLGFN